MEKKKAYIDTSLLIEYCKAEGSELELKGFEKRVEELNNSNKEKELKEVFDKFVGKKKVKERFELCKNLRKKQIYKKSDIRIIVSPLALIEYHKWYSETVLKNELTNYYNFKDIRSKGEKDIGEFYKGILKINNFDFRGNTPESTILGWARLDPYLVENDCFIGLELVDIKGLNISFADVWNKFSLFSILQIGLADILHLIVAIKFGCKYFLTLDSDFRAVKEIMLEYKDKDIEMIVGVDEIDKLFNLGLWH
ncbi:MAG: hypothetical protein PF487_08730 [Bacteroidales bacterium]|jgi:hypothetical protein|nr:hypothetical protein [Bacteroidales bacterium]